MGIWSLYNYKTIQSCKIHTPNMLGNNNRATEKQHPKISCMWESWVVFTQPKRTLQAASTIGITERRSAHYATTSHAIPKKIFWVAFAFLMNIIFFHISIIFKYGMLIMTYRYRKPASVDSFYNLHISYHSASSAELYILQNS